MGLFSLVSVRKEGKRQRRDDPNEMSDRCAWSLGTRGHEGGPNEGVSWIQWKVLNIIEPKFEKQCDFDIYVIIGF